MKIAGVGTEKHNKGEAIELKPVEKVPHAVRMALAEFDPDFAISIKDIKVGATRQSPAGDLLKKKFQNNRYFSEGTGTFQYIRKTTNTYLGQKDRSFKIEFCDCLDSHGMPELRVEKFDLKPL